MAKDKQYSGKDILSLSDRDHVRLRTQVYLGSMHPTEFAIPLLTEKNLTIKTVEFIPAVYKAIGEIVDNALDEFSQLTIRNKTLRIDADPANGVYKISDNGRGVPIDKHSTGKYTPEVVFGSLRSGRNFTDDKEVGVVGMNGVGSSCTNYCSEYFEVEINRDGQKYTQKFTNGGLKASKPVIVAAGKATGTSVSFKLDPAVFSSVALPEQLIRNRAVEIAMANPDVTVYYNGDKIKYDKGMSEIVSNLAATKSMQTFTFSDGNVHGDIHVIFDGHGGQEEQMFTWVNSSYLFDGGKCNTQFFNAFFDRVIDTLQPQARKAKADVTRNDVRSGLLVFANLKVKNPEYDSQAKTRLTGPDMRKDIVAVIDSTWKTFQRNAKDWLEQVLENASRRHHKEADDGAAKEHEKSMRQRKVEGLLDATSRNRSECQILITEGKCIDENVQIRTLSQCGWQDTPIKHANVGDVVLTHKNRMRAITSVSSVIKKGLTISTSSGSITCSREHKWLIYDTLKDEFGWLRTLDLVAGVHKLVRSKVADCCGYSTFTCEPQPDGTIKIVDSNETWIATPTHQFAVIDVATGDTTTVDAQHLDPLVHGLMLVAKQ